MTANAPVVLFVYDRPSHTRRTVEALSRNLLARETDLIIYSDGPRDEKNVGAVEQVREIVEGTSGFRDISVVKRSANVGLARNIVEGVTAVTQRYGRAIVLEDDLVSGHEFLTFMNDALDRFAGDRRVWHVSGWNYPIDPGGVPEYFFWPVMNCWGWATWADRWRHFVKDPDRLIRTWSAEKIRAFNVEGAHDFFAQVRENASGKIDTWAIFWYATIFENGGLCLNPTRSFIQNIGLDGSGTHRERRAAEEAISGSGYVGLPPIEVMPDTAIVERIRAHLRERYPSLRGRVWRKIAWYPDAVRGLLL